MLLLFGCYCFWNEFSQNIFWSSSSFSVIFVVCWTFSCRVSIFTVSLSHQKRKQQPRNLTKNNQTKNKIKNCYCFFFFLNRTVVYFTFPLDTQQSRTHTHIHSRRFFFDVENVRHHPLFRYYTCTKLHSQLLLLWISNVSFCSCCFFLVESAGANKCQVVHTALRFFHFAGSESQFGSWCYCCDCSASSKLI